MSAATQRFHRRALGLAYLLVLAGSIVLPLIQSLLPFNHVAPVDERRELARAPRLSLLLGNDTGGFMESLDRWASDRAGFRDLFIKVKNQIDYAVFGTSKKVYIGANGWLFGREVTDRRIAVERLSDDEYAHIELSFSVLAERLRQRGVRLVVVEYPDKSAFYSEDLPAHTPNFPQDGRTASLRNFLRGSSDIVFIAAQDLLEAKKAEGKEFYATDLHVTTWGSVPIVKEIIRRIAADQGRPDISWHESFNWQQGPGWTGSESRFLALLLPLHETIPFAPDFYSIGTDTPSGHWVTKNSLPVDDPDHDKLSVFDWQFTSRPELCSGKLPGAVLYGDSFSDPYASLGLQNYFCFLRRVRSIAVKLQAHLGEVPEGTKYFIYQFVDAYLLTEFPDVPDTKP
jgi:hypothetical protein